MRNALIAATYCLRLLRAWMRGNSAGGAIPGARPPGAQVAPVREIFEFTEGPVGPADAALLSQVCAQAAYADSILQA